MLRAIPVFISAAGVLAIVVAAVYLRRSVIALKKSPPKHLSAAAKRWYREIASEYEITDRAGLLLLTQAAEAWDRAAQCRGTIATDGITVRDKFGQIKAHPLLSCERDARAAFLHAVKHLNLDVAAIPGGANAKR